MTRLLKDRQVKHKHPTTASPMKRRNKNKEHKHSHDKAGENFVPKIHNVIEKLRLVRPEEQTASRPSTRSLLHSAVEIRWSLFAGVVACLKLL